MCITYSVQQSSRASGLPDPIASLPHRCRRLCPRCHRRLHPQTCTGAVACQLMDVLHPGSVHMSKVDFNYRTDVDYLKNYKELQKAFNSVSLDKVRAPVAAGAGGLGRCRIGS